jgi:hypothetical protein
MRSSFRVFAGVAAVTLAFGLTGCGDDGEGATEASDEPTETTDGADDAGATTTTAAPTPEEAAMAAYQASWDATFGSLDPAQELPEVAETMTGDALSETRNLIGEKARLGHRIEGSMQTSPVVVSAGESEVLLDDCAVETSVEYDAGGAVVDTAEGTSFNYRVTVVNEEGAWKVSQFERREEPCDAG